MIIYKYNCLIPNKSPYFYRILHIYKLYLFLLYKIFCIISLLNSLKSASMFQITFEKLKSQFFIISVRCINVKLH